MYKVLLVLSKDNYIHTQVFDYQFENQADVCAVRLDEEHFGGFIKKIVKLYGKKDA